MRIVEIQVLDGRDAVDFIQYLKVHSHLYLEEIMELTRG